MQGPARVRKGRKATYRVRITNSGDARAVGVKLKVRSRGFRLTKRIGKVAPGTTRTVKVKLKPKKTGKAKLTVRVKSSNAGSKSIKRRIFVRR